MLRPSPVYRRLDVQRCIKRLQSSLHSPDKLFIPANRFCLLLLTHSSSCSSHSSHSPLLLPLSSLASPPLSTPASQPETGNNTIQGRDYYGSYAPRKPSLTWPGTDKHCPTDVPEYCPCLDDPVCGFKCPSQWPYNKCTREPVFVDRYDWKGWKPGKHDPFSCGYVDKVTYEIDCKDLCLAHDNYNPCQVYTLDEAAEQFICALFEEIVDVATWEDD